MSPTPGRLRGDPGGDGLKRAAWFAGLWVAGVLTAGMVGLLIRTVLA